MCSAAESNCCCPILALNFHYLTNSARNVTRGKSQIKDTIFNRELDVFKLSQSNTFTLKLFQARSTQTHSLNVIKFEKYLFVIIGLQIAVVFQHA